MTPPTDLVFDILLRGKTAPPPFTLYRGAPERLLIAGMFEVLPDRIRYHVVTERLRAVEPTVDKFELRLMNQLATVYQEFGDYVKYIMPVSNSSRSLG